MFMLQINTFINTIQFPLLTWTGLGPSDPHVQEFMREAHEASLISQPVKPFSMNQLMQVLTTNTHILYFFCKVENFRTTTRKIDLSIYLYSYIKNRMSIFLILSCLILWIFSSVRPVVCPLVFRIRVISSATHLVPSPTLSTAVENGKLRVCILFISYAPPYWGVAF